METSDDFTDMRMETSEELFEELNYYLDLQDPLNMETGMLGSYRTEEEQFLKSGFDNMDSYIMDPSSSIDDRLLLRSSNSESNEDYGRTLSDWQRHVETLPANDYMVNSEECLANNRLPQFNLDILGYDSSKSSEFTPIVELNSESIVKREALGDSDNRLIDNANTSQCNIMSDIMSGRIDQTCDYLDSFSGEKLLDCDSLGINNIFDTSELNSNFANTEMSGVSFAGHNPSHPRSSQASQLHKKYSMSTRSKRKKQKSLSVPQSPEHDTYPMDNFDIPSSFCFEDIDAINFNEFVDNDINIAPEKAFNQSFDIAEAFYTKDDILKKEIGNSDTLFNSQINDCALDANAKDFDLTSYIMGKNDDQNFLIDCIPDADIHLGSDIKCDSEIITDDAPNDVLNTTSDLIDLTIKEENICSEPELCLPSSDSVLTSLSSIIKNEAILDFDNCESVHSPVGSSRSPCERKADTDDYIDVESVSDCESVPTLKANSVNALLEQFEATEDLSKSTRSVSKLTVHKASQSLKSNNVSKEPYLIYPKIWKNSWQKSAETKNNTKPNNSKVSKNVGVTRTPKSDRELVRLDHDYCFVSPTRSEPRIFGKNPMTKFDQTYKTSDKSEFVDLSSYYARPNNSRNFGQGRGKNMSVLRSSTEQSLSRNDSNLVLKTTSSSKVSLLKAKKSSDSISFTSVKEKVSIQSDSSSIADHSYSIVGSANGRYFSRKPDVNFPPKTSQEPVKSKLNNPQQANVNKVSNDFKSSNKKEVKNVIVVDNGTETVIDINKGQDAITWNRCSANSANKNSLLISNFKVQSEEKPAQNESIKLNICRVKGSRQKFSLLKPIVKENVKMISLLKSNYSDESELQKKKSQENLPTIPTPIQTPKNSTPLLSSVETFPKSEVPNKVVNNVIVSHKRKLNLEEYKRRREGVNNSCDNSRTCSPISIVTNDLDISNSVNNNISCINKGVNELTTNNSVKVPGVVTIDNGKPKRSPKKSELTTKLFDPIAFATKKALHLKKQSTQIFNEEKIIKSKISSVQNIVILPIATKNGKLLPMIKKKDDKKVEVAPAPSSAREQDTTPTREESPAFHQQKTPPPAQEEVVQEEYDKTDTICIGTNTDMSSFDRRKCDESETISATCQIRIPHFRDARVISHLRKTNGLKPKTQSVCIQADPDEILRTTVPISSLTISTVPIAAEPAVKAEDISRERRDSSMSISGDSNHSIGYAELLNRWKDDSAKKDKYDDRLSNASSNCSSSHKHSRTSKYKYRRRHDSQSPDPSKYRRRSGSYSRNRRRSTSLKSDDHASHTYGTSSKDKDNFDNRSIRSLPTSSKRKRNVSLSSDDWKERCSGSEIKVCQPPSKMSKDYEKDTVSQIGHRTSAKSRSSSSSSSSSCSSSSSSDSSSSRSSTPSSSSSRSNSRSSNVKYNRSRSRSVSRSRERSQYSKKRNVRYIRRVNELYEERKVLYVGMLESDITVPELKMKFIKYGCVEEVTIHVKEDGMRYGFITFAQAQQSYEALERSSKDPDIKNYDVFFGGRRAFCKQYYADLDDLEAMQEESHFYPAMVSRVVAPPPDQSFEHLLQETKAALSARKARDQSVLSDNRTKRKG